MKRGERTQARFILCSYKRPPHLYHSVGNHSSTPVMPASSFMVFAPFCPLSFWLTMPNVRLDASDSCPGGVWNNLNQHVSTRYLCHLWEGCLWSQPSLPGHGEALSHQLLHLLLLWWVKHTLIKHQLQVLLQEIKNQRKLNRRLERSFSSVSRLSLSWIHGSWESFIVCVRFHICYDVRDIRVETNITLVRIIGIISSCWHTLMRLETDVDCWRYNIDKCCSQEVIKEFLYTESKTLMLHLRTQFGRTLIEAVEEQ